MLDNALLEILACPKCKGKKISRDENGNETSEDIELEYDKGNQKIICNTCRLKYKIENNIPVMLIEEAESF
ncbi:Trm112 family protein [candidate division KSB1 bacterium]